MAHGYQGKVEKAGADDCEKHRLAFRAITILNSLEVCVSKLRNGFLNDRDFVETQTTMTRLKKEILEIDCDITENLDKNPPPLAK